MTTRVALVTGGTGGIGTAICKRLSDAGHKVATNYRNEERTQAWLEQMKQDGYDIVAVRGDVTSPEQAQAMVEEVKDRLGPVDILINNAGTDITESIEAVDQAAWDQVLQVNLRAPFVLAKRLFAGMRERGGGQIVNIVSTAAKRAWPNASAYHGSKWGLLGLSHAMHVEGRPHNIKVSAVVTGGMRTPFLLDRFPDIDPGTLQDPRTVADTVRFVLTQPDESVIAEVMVLPMRETSWP